MRRTPFDYQIFEKKKKKNQLLALNKKKAQIFSIFLNNVVFVIFVLSKYQFKYVSKIIINIINLIN